MTLQRCDVTAAAEASQSLQRSGPLLVLHAGEQPLAQHVRTAAHAGCYGVNAGSASLDREAHRQCLVQVASCKTR